MAIPNIIDYGSNTRTMHHVVSEPENPYRAREEITIASGAGKLVRGTMLGKRTRGAAATPGVVALTGNTGNATVGAVTADAHAAAGVYRVRFVTPTRYALYDPGGVEIARGTTGAALDSVLNFTITAGGTAMVAGEGFDITLAYAAGSQEFVAAQEANNDGSEVAVAVLWNDIDATSAAQRGTGHFRDTEFQTAYLVFAGSPTDTYKAACYASLATQGCAFR
jgi:hypothetical protein